MKHIVWSVVLALFVFSGCTIEEKTYTIYTIGDSTMSDKKENERPETGWCQVLEDYFEDNVSVSNHAKNGRSSKSFIDQGRWKTVLDSIKPNDYVFIQFGHNDEKIKSADRYTEPYGTYSENLRKFITETREKQATPILFTSIVRRKFGEDGKLMATHGDYPDAVRKVAQELNVPLIDLQKMTKEYVNNLGDEPSKALYLWFEPNEKFPKGKKDDTHLSVLGANTIAQLALDECIKQELPFAININKEIHP